MFCSYVYETWSAPHPNHQREGHQLLLLELHQLSVQITGWWLLLKLPANQWWRDLATHKVIILMPLATESSNKYFVWMFSRELKVEFLQKWKFATPTKFSFPYLVDIHEQATPLTFYWVPIQSCKCWQDRYILNLEIISFYQKCVLQVLPIAKLLCDLPNQCLPVFITWVINKGVKMSANHYR